MAVRECDVLIIGAGPAGLAAALYASRAKLSTVVLDKGTPGGQVRTTWSMENYPGFARGMTGPELMDRFVDHAKEFGAEIVRGDVATVSFGGELKIVTTQKGEEYRARAVIVAPGAEP
ncbi:MAG TPA: hypothetical protein DCL63_06995, partial [Firmicutes bacterium]|nr:hypothetical protein [Bacillota bacterium]